MSNIEVQTELSRSIRAGRIYTTQVIDSYHWELIQPNGSCEYFASKLLLGNVVLWDFRRDVRLTRTNHARIFSDEKNIYAVIVDEREIVDIVDIVGSHINSLNHESKDHLKIIALEQLRGYSVRGIARGHCDNWDLIEKGVRELDRKEKERSERLRAEELKEKNRVNEAQEALQGAARKARDAEHLPECILESLKKKKGGQVYDNVPVFRDHYHLNLWINRESLNETSLYDVAAVQNGGGYVGVLLGSSGKKEIGTLIAVRAA